MTRSELPLGAVALSCLIVLLGIFWCVPAQAATDEMALKRALRESWIYFEAGNLREAEAGFKRALELQGGKENAELQYGLSLIPWKRGLARQSYWQLQTALVLSQSAGEGGDEWRHRIKGRIRYIERNFSAVTLRYPDRGKPLSLLLDPPARDPVLRRFVESTGTMIQDGSSASDGAQRLFIPSGGYWVGDNHFELMAGALQPGEQQVIYLPVAFGPVLKRHKERLRMQEQGIAIAVPGKESSVEIADSSAALEPASSDAVFVPPPAPLEYSVVRSYLSDRTASEISERWTQVPFHVRYSVYCPDADAEHRFQFPDYEFYVRFDPGGELRVKGIELLRVSLGSDWLVGDSSRFNEVEFLFDGTTVLVVVNGMEFGPVRVRESPPSKPGIWAIEMSDDRERITYLSVRAPE